MNKRSLPTERHVMKPVVCTICTLHHQLTPFLCNVGTIKAHISPPLLSQREEIDRPLPSSEYLNLWTRNDFFPHLPRALTLQEWQRGTWLKSSLLLSGGLGARTVPWPIMFKAHLHPFQVLFQWLSWPSHLKDVLGIKPSLYVLGKCYTLNSILGFQLYSSIWHILQSRITHTYIHIV